MGTGCNLSSDALKVTTDMSRPKRLKRRKSRDENGEEEMESSGSDFSDL